MEHDRSHASTNQLLQQNVLEFGKFQVIDDVTIESSVPHRAELSDMHAIILRGPLKSLLFTRPRLLDETLEAHNCDSIRSF